MLTSPRWLLLGRRLVPVTPPPVSVFDASVFQGLGLFETVGCQDGRPLLWRWHQERLLVSAKELFGASPRLPEEGDLCRLLMAEGLNRKAAALRVVWWVGRRQTLSWAAPYRPPGSKRKRGVELVSFVQPSTPLCAFKTTSYLPLKLTAWQAANQGATAVLVEPSGEVREADHANLFAVFGNTIVTPPAPPRALPGVLRRFCLEALPGCGFSVEERDFTLSQLQSADGAFLTSSLSGVVPVRRIDGQDLPPPEGVIRALEAFGIPAPGYARAVLQNEKS